MRRMSCVGLLLLLSPGLLLAANKNKAGKPAAPPAIARLGWLAGSWRAERGGQLVDEQWMAPAAGVMLGMARTVARGRELEHDFMQIREGPGGLLFFVAQPSGQATAATYQIAALADGTVTFENREQDFPQVITYALQPDGTVQVTLEGAGADGTARRTEFTYRKITP